MSYHSEFYMDTVSASPYPTTETLEKVQKAWEARKRADALEQEFPGLPSDTFKNIRREFRQVLCQAMVQMCGAPQAALALIGTGGGRQCPGAGTARGQIWTNQANALCKQVGIPVPSGLIRSQASGGSAWSAAIQEALREEVRAMEEALRECRDQPKSEAGEAFYTQDHKVVEALKRGGLFHDADPSWARVLRECPSMAGQASVDQLGVCLAILQNELEDSVRYDADVPENSIEAIHMVAGMLQDLKTSARKAEETPKEMSW